MYPLVLSMLAAVLVALWMAFAQPADIQLLRQTQDDVHAANFWTYRSALVAYQNDHPNHHGPIPDAALSAPLPQRPTGYFPLGYTPMQTGTAPLTTGLWNNFIEEGRLYTFSNIPASDLPHGVIDAIANRNGRSLMFGIKQHDGTVTTLYKLNTPPHTGGVFPIPPATAIPEGALVIIGN